MIKSFIAGIILGIAACTAALQYLPVVDQHREVSMISVKPNGSNYESFHVNDPIDRIMIGAPQQEKPFPAGLEWPSDEKLSDVRVELFKIRNSKDSVVGVASRLAVDPDGLIEWVLHLPARGSVYLSIQPESIDGGYRVGKILSGTREFDSLQGQVTERWVADTSGLDDAPTGRIELQTVLAAKAEL